MSTERSRRSHFLKAGAVWLVIIAGETVHGTLRTLFLEPLVGGAQARRIAVFTGSVIIFLITLAFIRWIGARGAGTLLLIGAMWTGLTVAFELILGRLILGLTWDRLLSDYDLTQGGLMIFGLVFLLFAPLLAARARGISDG